MDPLTPMRELCAQARAGAAALQAAGAEGRTRALRAMAEALRVAEGPILTANAADMEAAHGRGSDAAFLDRLRTRAQTLDIHERQRIVRLLVKEVLVADNTIVIRHSIPVHAPHPGDSDLPPPPPEGRSPSGDQDYLLCPRRGFTDVGEHLSSLCLGCVVRGNRQGVV